MNVSQPISGHDKCVQADCIKALHDLTERDMALVIIARPEEQQDGSVRLDIREFHWNSDATRDAMMLMAALHERALHERAQDDETRRMASESSEEAHKAAHDA